MRWGDFVAMNVGRKAHAIKDSDNPNKYRWLSSS